MEAVKNNGTALLHVPGHLKTEGICIFAIRQNISSLVHVPESMRTPEFLQVLKEIKDTPAQWLINKTYEQYIENFEHIETPCQKKMNEPKIA